MKSFKLHLILPTTCFISITLLDSVKGERGFVNLLISKLPKG